MQSELHIARGLKLDADYVGSGTFALLAKKGAGKSYLARVMAEEFWKAKVPFVLMDPMGTSWGLRSSADGDGEGIPVAIFGGEKGDAPLERTSGELLADLVVDEGLSMILDLSELGSRAAERQFAKDFLDRLYRRNRDLVHVLMDEADLFAPQNAPSGDKPLLGVTENIVRRGRNRGIGITLITQRPAVLNKDVLTQVDGLVPMRIVGLTDREAVDKWVAGHGEPDEAAKVKGTLAGLENGECWWWIPELGILDRVQVRKSRTFDSSPSRKRGERKREPKSFADVDMGAVEEKMAATIERAKAEDPRELQKEVAGLKKEITGLQSELESRPDVEPERVEVPVIKDEQVRAVQEAAHELRLVGANIVGDMEKALAPVGEAVDGLHTAIKGASHSQPRVAPVPSRPAPRRAEPKPRPEPRVDPGSNGRVTGPQQRIIDALGSLEAIHAARPRRTQVALFALASPTSSGFEKNLSTLRTNGLIDYPEQGRVCLTAEGRKFAEGIAPATIEELHEFAANLLKPAKWRLVKELIECYPEAITREQLADWADASPTSSGFEKNLSTLRSLGLIDYPQRGYVAATPILFLEPS